MADYPWTYFAVKCDSAHNRALIRFVVIDSGSVKMGSIIRRDQLITDKSYPGYDVPALPASLNARWQGIPYRNETGCTLQNGQTITLEQEGGPEGQGMDQAIADEYFTMKIDNHFVFFHYPFYSGFGPTASGLILDAVEYAGGRLFLCKPAETDGEGNVIYGPKCLDESKRLLPGDKYLTQIEKYALWIYRRRQKLTRAVSPFCKSIYAGLIPGTTPNDIVFYFEKKHFLDGMYYSVNTVALYNNGKPGRAVEVGELYSDTLNYNDRSFIFYFGNDQSDYEKFITFLKKHGINPIIPWFDSGINATDSAKSFAPWRKFYVGIPKNWPPDSHDFFSGSWVTRPRVNTIIGFRGSVYVFTMPNALMTFGAVSAVIIRKLMPDKSEKLVCAFPSMVTPDRRF